MNVTNFNVRSQCIKLGTAIERAQVYNVHVFSVCGACLRRSCETANAGYFSIPSRFRAKFAKHCDAS